MRLRIGLIASVLGFMVGCNSAGSFLPAARVADEPPDGCVIRYLFSADSGVIELWMPEDSTLEYDDAVWEEVSLDSLHAMGIYSPSENMAQAIEDSTAGEEGTTAGGNYRSYITCRRIYNRWQITLGSETWRSGVFPGWCFVAGDAYQQATFYWTGMRRQIGWKAYVQAPPKFETQSYLYMEYGWHAFTQSGYPDYHSYASGYYP